jgi:hypothetical protein
MEERTRWVPWPILPGSIIALGISYAINGFCWLTIGNGFLGWAYIACKIWQVVVLKTS